MTVGDQGRCYRIVTDSFGEKENNHWTRGAATARVGGAGKLDYQQDSTLTEVEESGHSVVSRSHDNHRGYRGRRDNKKSVELSSPQPYIEG